MDTVPEAVQSNIAQAALAPIDGASAQSHLWLELLAFWRGCHAGIKKQITQTVVLLACIVCDYCELCQDEQLLGRFNAQSLEDGISRRIDNISNGNGDDSIQLAGLVHRLISSYISTKSTRYSFNIYESYSYRENFLLWGSLAGVQFRGNINNFRPQTLSRALSRTEIFERAQLTEEWCVKAINAIKQVACVACPSDLSPIPGEVVMDLCPALSHGLRIFVEAFREEEARESRAELPEGLLFMVWACYKRPAAFSATWLYNWVVSTDARGIMGEILHSDAKRYADFDSCEPVLSSSWLEEFACHLIVLYYCHWNVGIFKRCDRLPSNSLTGEFNRMLNGEAVPDPQSVLRRVLAAVVNIMTQKSKGNSNLLADIMEANIVSPADMTYLQDLSILTYLSRREGGSTHDAAVRATHNGNSSDQNVDSQAVSSERRKRPRSLV